MGRFQKSILAEIIIMRIIIVLAVISGFFVCCKANQEKDKSGISLTEAEVEDFIREYDAIWANRDTSLVKRVIDDSYTYFTSTGSTIGRDGIISWFAPADKYKVEKAGRTEVSVQMKGNTAIVSSRWTGNGSFGSEKFNDDQRCGLVIQKSNGKIKLLAEHCTQIVAGNGAE